MCLFCGLPGRHAFALAERPAERLRGRVWSGAFEAAEEGVARLVAEIAAGAAEGPWRAGVIGLSLAGDGDELRYFAGIADDGAPLADGWTRIETPAARYAASWHEAGDGPIAAHYARLMGWIMESGLRRDDAAVELREEYPAGYDAAGAPALRLMIPVRSA